MDNIYIDDRGHRLKLLKREGEDVTVLNLDDGFVNHYHIDWLMEHTSSKVMEETLKKAK
jgi:hypothetical protein